MGETFKPGAVRALFFSTTAFAVSFAVWGLIPALTLTLALGASATAQTTASTSHISDNPPATVKPAATPQGTTAKAPRELKLGKVNVGGSLRLRAESYGWFETPGHQDEYTFGAAQLRLSVGQQREGWDRLVEGQFTGLFNLPERAVAPAPRGQLGLGDSYFAAHGERDAGAVLKQAFVKVPVPLYKVAPLTMAPVSRAPAVPLSESSLGVGAREQWGTRKSRGEPIYRLAGVAHVWRLWGAELGSAGRSAPPAGDAALAIVVYLILRQWRG